MLEVERLEVRYGRLRALRGASLAVAEGEIVALIGANGAGKSSLLNAVCGLVPYAGEVRFRGERLDGLGPHRIARRGLTQVPEGRMLFAGLSVQENLLLGGYPVRDRRLLERTLQEVLELFPVLRERREARGDSLSGGQAQILALARGLMARPRLLLLDEPSLGLAPLTAREVFALIAGLRERGITVLLVEQNVRQALAIADRGYVLEAGRVALEGPAGELLGHELLVSSYLGLRRTEGEP